MLLSIIALIIIIGALDIVGHFLPKPVGVLQILSPARLGQFLSSVVTWLGMLHAYCPAIGGDAIGGDATGDRQRSICT